MTCVSSHQCLWSLVVRKGVPAKEIYFHRGKNLSRQKQNYRFYLFDKSWNLSDRNAI